VIKRKFFQRDPLTCARELIGCTLVWEGCEGIIVETEAYAARGDEASHTFVRPSTRAFVAEYPPGAAYVYFNYGMYWLLNVLVKGGDEDGFVLFRAIEPTRGIKKMEARRNQRSRIALCSGPGKLAQALDATGQDHGRDFCAGSQIGFRKRCGPVDVVEDVRIGISRSALLPWRFLLKDSPYISARPKAALPNSQKVPGRKESVPRNRKTPRAAVFPI
jgi:DNA-3-methyladenine glycosylase